jgi:hypothetical protein
MRFESYEDAEKIARMIEDWELFRGRWRWTPEPASDEVVFGPEGND